jgi:Spy/CpxP family protein refolding chaperone
MATIKESHLKQIFNEYGISDGVWDIFNKKRKRLKKQLKQTRADIEDTIQYAPKDQQKKLKDLAAAFDNAYDAGVFTK